MHTSRIMSFFIPLCSLFMYSAVKNTSGNNLPLVLVMQEGELKYPNQIQQATIKENLGFTGDTQFSKNDNNNQLFFCPAESNEQLDEIDQYNRLILVESSQRLSKIFIKSAMTASKNCLFNKTFEKEDPLRCDEDPKPIIEPLTSGKLNKRLVPGCGPNSQGVLYKFAYEVCTSTTRSGRIKSFIQAAVVFKFDVAKMQGKLPFVYSEKKVYKICYNHHTEETIYTKHKLSPFSLLFDERLKQENSKEFTMMIDNYGHFNDFSTLKYFYDLNIAKQNKLSNAEKSDIVETSEHSDIYLPEKLVPPDDLTTAVLRRPTFHYINVKPMHEGLVELWNHIAKLIRENFRQKPTYSKIEIFTGAFRRPNHPSPKSSTPNIPELWIKVIYENNPKKYNNSSLAIVMRNDVKSTKDPYYYDYALSSMCDENHCKFFQQDEEMVNKFSYLVDKIRCCPFNENINDFFKIILNVDGTLLPIVNLTEGEEKK